MNIDTLIANSNLSASASGRLKSFDPDSFNEAVMDTYARFPIALERDAGCRVWDTTGKNYLDFVAGIATCTLGHAHPAVVETVSRQIQTLHHVSNLFYIPVQAQLAQWLVQHSCMELAVESELTAADVVKAAIAEGLLLVPAGPKVLRFVPPLIVTEAEVNLALQILERAIEGVRS